MKFVGLPRSVFDTTNAAIGVICCLTFTLTACIFASLLADYADRPSINWIMLCTVFSMFVGPLLGFTYLRPAAQSMFLGLSMVTCALSLVKIFIIL